MILRFEDCELDTDRCEIRRHGQDVHVEPQVFDLLCFLVEHRDRIVSKDELFDAVWQGRIVSDATLNSRINAARKAIGDSGAEQRFIRTTPRRGYRFVGKLDKDEDAPSASSGIPLRQKVQFCMTPDGVRIAYATLGEGALLVKAANWLNHLEYDWESALWRSRLEQVAAGRRLVRYDARGCGLSDWDVADISFDGFVRDLETVVDALELKRFALWGLSQGCPVSIAYAVRRPERVSHLILLGGYVQGRNRRNDPAELEKAAALRSLIRHGWGDEHSPLLRALSTTIMPGATTEQVRALAEMQRRSATADNAMRTREACDDIDIVPLLPQVGVPTLVLHSRHDAVAPFEQGLLMASSIPGARFVSLDSENHIPLPDEPAWERFVAELNAFLATA